MKQLFSTLQSRAVAAALFLSVAIEPVMAQQLLQPRLPGIKLNLEQLLTRPGANGVVIKFREDSQIRLINGRLVGAVTAEVAAVQALIRQTQLFASLHRLFGDLTEAQLNAQREEAQRISGRVLADLNLYFVLPTPTKLIAAQLAAQLNALPIVEFADLSPVHFPPPAATPDLTQEQSYKNAPPQGVGVLDPAKAPGSDGSGMSFVDVEYSWQLNHEDLKVPTARVIKSGTPVDPFNNTDHGTAVLGEIVGLKNAYGVTGIAPAAITKLSPAETKENNYDPATAILLASNSLNPGDVIVIEQQYPVCGHLTCDANTQAGCGPLEALQAVHDVIANVTALNRIVVAAAGNGNVNLDDATCNGAFDRATKDSGAIIVGAGHSADRTRMDFSSYGTRIDVQGWGENVVTTGYGDAFNPNIQQRYTRTFGGTSGATPIVAGAVLAIQGRLKACHLPLATPAQMRQALAASGTPQPTSDAGHIGPLPQISAALSALGVDKCITPPPMGQ